jgi:hypothetical protein
LCLDAAKKKERMHMLEYVIVSASDALVLDNFVERENEPSLLHLAVDVQSKECSSEYVVNADDVRFVGPDGWPLDM